MNTRTLHHNLVAVEFFSIYSIEFYLNKTYFRFSFFFFFFNENVSYMECIF